MNNSTAALDYDGVNLLSVSELQKYTLIKVLNFSIILLSFFMTYQNFIINSKNILFSPIKKVLHLIAITSVIILSIH